jgi:hypothetical protein
MPDLTPEQLCAVDAAAGRPLRFVDRRTQEVYVLVPVAVYDDLARNASAVSDWEIPEGIGRAKAALRRDLPALLADTRNRGKCVCYCGDERVGIGDYATLIRECNRRALPDDAVIVERIAAGAGTEEEVELDRTFTEIDEELA